MCVFFVVYVLFLIYTCAKPLFIFLLPFFSCACMGNSSFVPSSCFILLTSIPSPPLLPFPHAHSSPFCLLPPETSHKPSQKIINTVHERVFVFQLYFFPQCGPEFLIKGKAKVPGAHLCIACGSVEVPAITCYSGAHSRVATLIQTKFSTNSFVLDEE